MTDFVDVLEQQLRDAHGRRARPVPPWRAGIVLVAAAAAAAVIVALVVGLASPRTQQPPAQQQTTPPVTTPVKPVAPTHLAILNGTTITGLARAAADTLVANGYSEPNVVMNDTTNQHRKHSEVFYEAGYRNEAFSVADCLHIRFDRVHEMTPDARALADRANIAVFVGADQPR
ncbi:MAG TPA: LytR C-terminal domain-containing protein [Solirubrobacteraceae bacterium]|nr:LytR C-terminal domain-containing protein [Solirubrobacteraceae bacterium]